MVALSVLGPVEVRAADGSEVRVGSTRQRRLVAALALRAGTTVSVDALAELVWGDDQPADPAGAVQTNVARLRRLLPEALRVETEPTGYRLVVPPGELDVAAFEEHVARAAAAGDPERRAAHLDAALLLWRGQPFADLDHPSLAAELARLAELRASAVESRAEALLGAGHADDAIAVLEAFVAEEPLRERPVGLLMRALTAAGRQAEALRAYARLRSVLLDQLGLDPSPELQQLEQQVLRQELPAAPRRGSRVPLPVSTFVGRDADVERVADLLDRCRVVTLCGPGGVGKSRLALHAADAAAGGYPDGVIVVSLASLVDGADVAATVAGALRVTGHAGEALADRVAEVLAVRRLLLLLDDCEHVADAVAPLVEHLVAAAPGVDVLATSREPLRADGEHVYPVPPLPPEAAEALLADRASAASPGMAVDGLGGVARRLDGLPLAIELAAARLPALGAGALEAALAEPFDVLTGGRRGARHRSLLEVVDWSYGSLGDTERALFDAMAVFDGPVDATAVAAVCGAPAGAIADLVDRSLLTAVPGERPAYGMLDTIRAYGRRRLAEGGRSEAMRDRHATWAAAEGKELLAALSTPHAPAAVRRLDALAADLRAGFQRLVRTRRLDELFQLGILLGNQAFHCMRDDLALVVEEAVDALWDEAHPTTAVLVGWSGTRAWVTGDLDEAVRRAHRSLAMADELGDPILACEARGVLANVAIFRGDLETAGAEVREAVRLGELLRQVPDVPYADGNAVMHRIDLVLVAAYSGDPMAAEISAEMSAMAATTGSPLLQAWACYVEGERLAIDDPVAAAPHLEHAIALAEEVDAALVAGVARHTLLTTAARSSSGAAAVAGFAPLVDHWHRAGAWTQLWVAVRALVEVLSRLERHEDVARLCAADRASSRSGVPFGPDLARREEAEARAADALGDRYDELVAEGERMGDEGTVAFVRALTG